MAQSNLLLDPWAQQTTPNNTLHNHHGDSVHHQLGDDAATPTPPWLFLLLPMILCSILGNVLVILAVMIERKLQNKINYFLQSLAVADLMVSVMVMPLGFVNDYLGKLHICLFIDPGPVTCVKPNL